MAPAHQTPGVHPTAIRTGDHITITLGDHGAEKGVRVNTTKALPNGRVRIDWTEIDQHGKVPHSAGSGFGTDLSGPEGGTWHWWATRKPADSNPNNPHGRHRVILAAGDGECITRVASRYPAVASVYVAPPGERADTATHPGVKLTVAPDGRWKVEIDHPTRRWPVLVASGHIDQAPGTMTGDAARAVAATLDVDGAYAMYAAGRAAVAAHRAAT